MKRAFKQILDDRPCHMAQSVKGIEFVNSTFQSMRRCRGIKFYTSENEDIKAVVAERFNRTLKEKMYRYFTVKNTQIRRRSAGSHICIQSSIDWDGTCGRHSRQGGCNSGSTIELKR